MTGMRALTNGRYTPADMRGVGPSDCICSAVFAPWGRIPCALSWLAMHHLPAGSRLAAWISSLHMRAIGRLTFTGVFPTCPTCGGQTGKPPRWLCPTCQAGCRPAPSNHIACDHEDHGYCGCRHHRCPCSAAEATP